MTLRLRDDAYLARTHTGVYILTSDGPVTLTGHSVARWIEALTPRLDGRFTLADLTSELPAAHAAYATELLTRLLDAGVVREVGAAQPPAVLDDPARQAYAAEIAYLAAQVDAAEAAFARFRALTVVVLGGGDWAYALSRSLDGCGAADVRVLPADAAAAAIRVADLVLHVAEPTEPAEIDRVDAACWRDGVPVAHLLHTGREAWLTPLTGGAGDAMTTTARLPSVIRRAGRPAAAEPVAPVQVTVAAAQLARCAFRWATGTADPRQADRVVRIGPELTSHRHHCLPHPYDLPAARMDAATVADRFRTLRDLSGVSDQDFSEQAVRAADDLFGAFRYLPDDTTSQHPVHIAEAAVRDPYAGEPGGGEVVRAVAFSYPTARIEAARRALTRYGALMVDPRRLVDRNGSPLVAPDTGPVDLTAWDTTAASAGLAPGYDLHTGRVVPVPAVEVFDRLGAPRGLGEGFGATWPAAVLRGLTDHWRHDPTLIGDPGGRPVRVEPDTLDEVAQRCVTILDALGELPEVRDHGGRHGVTVLSFRRGAQVLTRSVGTAVDAWREGLLHVLVRVQEWLHDAGGRPPAPEQQPATPTSPARAGDRGLDLDAVVAGLAATGRRAVAVPLDHDPAVAAILPHALKVVLTDD